MEETGIIWRNFFASWPSQLSHTGVVVASGIEQTPFVSFLMAEHVVMLERPAPDTVGARKVIVPYCKINSVKITEAVGHDVFLASGFIAPRSLQSEPSKTQ